jgi:hypothetical protein
MVLNASVLQLSIDGSECLVEDKEGYKSLHIDLSWFGHSTLPKVSIAAAATTSAKLEDRLGDNP